MTEETKETQFFKQESTDNQVAEDLENLPVEEQVAALRRGLEEARKEVEQQRDLAQRAQAELANFRRRTDEERISLQQYSNSRLLIKLLPVVDELALAVNHADESGLSDSWLEGVKLIQRKVTNLLESEGISKIAAVGVQFDPVEHEAVGTQETTKHPPGYIVEVVRNGYRLHDRVIQPAQVVVAKQAPQPNQTGDHTEL
ncbi:MAG TPA: nucleotide exchange factor GrpE [Dehalococcoidia bacterium]|jgi:molecular chaperone GrpE|nr:nucleotide exchange factor GrpE [Dehalococcoidia bacterium]